VGNTPEGMFLANFILERRERTGGGGGGVEAIWFLVLMVWGNSRRRFLYKLLLG